jgi:hypothetical protein
MDKLLTSASKLVFLLMTIALIVLTFSGRVDAKDFVVLASMVFTFYFSNKGTPQDDFLGK